jgi:hypothetical protein
MRYKNREKLTKEELEIHNKHCCYIQKCGYKCLRCEEFERLNKEGKLFNLF